MTDFPNSAPDTTSDPERRDLDTGVCFLAGPPGDPRTELIATQLNACGVTVLEPTQFHCGDSVTSRRTCVRAQLEALLRCDAVVLTPGWNCDRDALRAVGLARDLDMPVYTAAAGRLFDPFPAAAGPGHRRREVG